MSYLFRSRLSGAAPLLATTAPTSSYSTPETTHLLVNATIQRLEAQEATRFCNASATATWVQNNQLNWWATKMLGGQWPARATDKENIQPAYTQYAATPSSAFDDAGLAREVLSPQARDALSALAQNAYNSPAVDSDVVLGILNAGPVPDILLAVPDVIVDEQHPVELRSLLSPRAQAGLSAIARGTWASPDADALLEILNGGVELEARDIDDATAPDIHVKGPDSWMEALLSDRAREGLTALAQRNGTVEDSDALLDILNGGDDPSDGDSIYSEPSWIADLLALEGCEMLDALEEDSDDGMVEDSDALFDILDAGNSDDDEWDGNWEAELLSAGVADLVTRRISNGVPAAEIFTTLLAAQPFPWASAATKDDLVIEKKEQPAWEAELLSRAFADLRSRVESASAPLATGPRVAHESQLTYSGDSNADSPELLGELPEEPLFINARDLENEDQRAESPPSRRPSPTFEELFPSSRYPGPKLVVEIEDDSGDDYSEEKDKFVESDSGSIHIVMHC